MSVHRKVVWSLRNCLSTRIWGILFRINLVVLGLETLNGRLLTIHVVQAHFSMQLCWLIVVSGWIIILSSFVILVQARRDFCHYEGFWWAWISCPDWVAPRWIKVHGYSGRIWSCYPWKEGMIWYQWYLAVILILW